MCFQMQGVLQAGELGLIQASVQKQQTNKINTYNFKTIVYNAIADLLEVHAKPQQSVKCTILVD